MINPYKTPRRWLRMMFDALVIGWHMGIVDEENRNPQMREWNDWLRSGVRARARVRVPPRRCDRSGAFIGSNGRCPLCYPSDGVCRIRIEDERVALEGFVCPTCSRRVQLDRQSVCCPHEVKP